MLVLSRKSMEEIRIGPDVTIKILTVRGSTVKIGIEAPPSKEILRGELIGNDGAGPSPSKSPLVCNNLVSG